MKRKNKVLTKKQWERFQINLVKHLRKDIAEAEQGIKRDKEIIGRMR